MYEESRKQFYSKVEYTKERFALTRGPYNSINQEHVTFFQNLLGCGRVKTDAADLEQYNVDWFLQFRGNSSVVLKPRTTEEVSKILSYCNEKVLAVCPHGGNTGACGASVAIFDEIIISAELMNTIISLDALSGILVCQAGCVLDNLNKYLDDKNLIMPVDIGSKRFCQIGGNVSTNAGGFRYARFGSLHGNVLGIEAVKADGEVLDCLKTLKKDNTGYHLKNLFIGSEGTLGFITKVAVQCIAKPKAVNVAFLALDSFENVIKTYMLAKDELGEILSAAELMDATSLQLTCDELKLQSPIVGIYPFSLLIETYGSNAKHDSEKMKRFVEATVEKKLAVKGIVAADISEQQPIWKLRESIGLTGRQYSYTFSYDVTLPLEDYYSIVQIMKEHMGQKESSVFGFGHLGDGNIHLHIVVPEYSKEMKEHIEPFIYKKVIELKGSISAEHGLGFRHARHLNLARSEPYIKTMKDLKTLMDPKGILNPYKVLFDTNQ